MRLANQTSTANPHVGGVGGPMVTQVTQTRRTIYPSIQGDMMRTVGHDLQYQQPGEILQMHAYLRCRFVGLTCVNRETDSTIYRLLEYVRELM